MNSMITPAAAHDGDISQRADHLLHESRSGIYCRTDRLFAGLMVLQWIAGIIAAVWISPQTWAGAYSETHLHVWSAILLGGLITLFPVCLALIRPGTTLTRHVVAISQMLTSALLIHLSGGRIERVRTALRRDFERVFVIFMSRRFGSYELRHRR